MTPLQLRALEFIRERVAATGVSPTIVEIDGYLGTHGRASDMINALVGMGVLTRERGKARSLRLAAVPDVRLIDDAALVAELARRGLTLDALKGPGQRAFNRGAVSCAADCCQERVRPGHLFCLDHWRALPPELQREILATFRARDVDAYQAAVTRARDLIDCGRAAA